MATFVVDPQLMKRRIAHSACGYISTFSRVHSMKSAKHLVNMKPPNILIYYPKNVKQCSKDCVNAMVQRCLPPYRYVVYSLSYERAITDPWMENCQLLFVPSLGEKEESFGDQDVKLLEKYLSQKGRIINFSQNAMKYFGFLKSKTASPITEYEFISGDRSFSISNDNWEDLQICTNSDNITGTLDTILFAKSRNGDKVPVAVKCMTKDNGQMIHCSLPLLKVCALDCNRNINSSDRTLIQEFLNDLEILTQSESELQTEDKEPCYLLSNDLKKTKDFLSIVGINDSTDICDVKGVSVTLRFMQFQNSVEADNSAGPNQLSPVLVFYSHKKDTGWPQVKFNWVEYWANLKTEKFGRVVLYSDLVTSTMNIVEPLVSKLCISKNMNITCIAHQQSSGKGRGGNKWLSPPGTAMFTTVFSVPLQSRLGQHLSIVQHFVTVAVVHAVRSIPTMEKLDLRVKWPNDIYMGSSVKIGGVLVKSTIFQNLFTVTIGCGVNVSNRFPTKCINDAIKAGNLFSKPLSCEEVIARSISCLEKLINTYQTKGPKEFFDLYHKYWIHSDQQVQVQCQANPGGPSTLVNGKVTGIDDRGFLTVAVSNTLGNVIIEEISVQPDGNSFDMTKNLIAIKSCH